MSSSYASKYAVPDAADAEQAPLAAAGGSGSASEAAAKPAPAKPAQADPASGAHSSPVTNGAASAPADSSASSKWAVADDGEEQKQQRSRETTKEGAADTPAPAKADAMGESTSASSKWAVQKEDGKAEDAPKAAAEAEAAAPAPAAKAEQAAAPSASAASEAKPAASPASKPSASTSSTPPSKSGASPPAQKKLLPPNPFLRKPVLYLSKVPSSASDAALASGVFAHCLPVRINLERQSAALRAAAAAAWQVGGAGAGAGAGEDDDGALLAGSVEFQSIQAAELAYATILPTTARLPDADPAAQPLGIELGISPYGVDADPPARAKRRLIRGLSAGVDTDADADADADPDALPALLFPLVRAYGPVRRIALVAHDARSGAYVGFRGEATLEMYNEQDAAAAQDGLNGREVNGQRIEIALDEVQRASPVFGTPAAPVPAAAVADKQQPQSSTAPATPARSLSAAAAKFTPGGGASFNPAAAAFTPGGSASAGTAPAASASGSGSGSGAALSGASSAFKPTAAAFTPSFGAGAAAAPPFAPAFSAGAAAFAPRGAGAGASASGYGAGAGGYGAGASGYGAYGQDDEQEEEDHDPDLAHADAYDSGYAQDGYGDAYGDAGAYANGYGAADAGAYANGYGAAGAGAYSNGYAGGAGAGGYSNGFEYQVANGFGSVGGGAAQVPQHTGWTPEMPTAELDPELSPTNDGRGSIASSSTSQGGYSAAVAAPFRSGANSGWDIHAPEWEPDASASAWQPVMPDAEMDGQSAHHGKMNGAAQPPPKKVSHAIPVVKPPAVTQAPQQPQKSQVLQPTQPQPQPTGSAQLASTGWGGPHRNWKALPSKSGASSSAAGDSGVGANSWEWGQTTGGGGGGGSAPSVSESHPADKSREQLIAEGIDPCNLFVKNLPQSIDSNELFHHFKRFGRIVSARVMLDDATGASREFGFVSFKDHRDAQLALREMDGIMMEGPGDAPGEGKIVNVYFHESKELRGGKLAAKAAKAAAIAASVREAKMAKLAAWNAGSKNGSGYGSGSGYGGGHGYGDANGAPNGPSNGQSESGWDASNVGSSSNYSSGWEVKTDGPANNASSGWDVNNTSNSNANASSGWDVSNNSNSNAKASSGWDVSNNNTNGGGSSGWDTGNTSYHAGYHANAQAGGANNSGGQAADDNGAADGEGQTAYSGGFVFKPPTDGAHDAQPAAPAASGWDMPAPQPAAPASSGWDTSAPQPAAPASSGWDAAPAPQPAASASSGWDSSAPPQPQQPQQNGYGKGVAFNPKGPANVPPAQGKQAPAAFSAAQDKQASAPAPAANESGSLYSAGFEFKPAGDALDSSAQSAEPLGAFAAALEQQSSRSSWEVDPVQPANSAAARQDAWSVDPAPPAHTPASRQGSWPIESPPQPPESAIGRKDSWSVDGSLRPMDSVSAAGSAATATRTPRESFSVEPAARPKDKAPATESPAPATAFPADAGTDGVLSVSELAALPPSACNKVLTDALDRRIRELPPVARGNMPKGGEQRQAILQSMVSRLSLAEAAQALRDNAALARHVKIDTDAMRKLAGSQSKAKTPRKSEAPAPSDSKPADSKATNGKNNRSVSGPPAGDSASLLSAAPASNKERARILKAIRSLDPPLPPSTLEVVEDLTDMIVALPKKERALCLFNSEILRSKVEDAKEILDMSDGEDGSSAPVPAPAAVSVSPRPAARAQKSKSPAAQKVAAPASASVPAAAAVAPPATNGHGPKSAKTYTLAELAALPATEIISIASRKSTTGLPVPKADPTVVRDTDAFVDGLAGMTAQDQKQKLGDSLFKKIKSFGIKGAPKLTISLLDSEDLRALAHLMNSYPECLKEKVLQLASPK